MQGINGEAWVVLRGERLVQLQASHFRFGAEIQLREINVYVAGRDSAEYHGFQIGQINGAVVRGVAAMDGNVSGMKPLVFHGEPVGGIASVEIHFFSGVPAVSGKLDMAAGRVSLAQDRPQVIEAQLAAVPERPGRLREIGEICLCIEFDAGRLPLQLRHGKGILPESESRGDIRGKRHVSQRGDLKFLPADPAEVDGSPSSFA